MINKIDKFLPLGSVVILKDAVKRLMIVGYCARIEADDNAPYYDYVGCLYPEGIFTSEQSIVFNHDDVDKILYQGLYDEEAKKFESKLKVVANKLKGKE